MRARKNREVNIFSASVVDLFASGLGVFLIVAIIALVNQKKEHSKVVNPEVINKENNKIIADLEKKIEAAKVELNKARTENATLKAEAQNFDEQTVSEKLDFAKKLEKKKTQEAANEIINSQRNKIALLVKELREKSSRLDEAEKGMASLKEIYQAEKKSQVKSAQLNVSSFEVGTKIKLNNVQFYAGTEKTIEPYASSEIRELSKVLLENRSIKVEVSGHIFLSKDELAKGEVYDDSNLSTRRAKVVCAKLVEMGVSGDRLKCVGYGGQRYLYLTNDQYSREAQLNRRVEVEILAK